MPHDRPMTWLVIHAHRITYNAISWRLITNTTTTAEYKTAHKLPTFSVLTSVQSTDDIKLRSMTKWQFRHVTHHKHTNRARPTYIHTVQASHTHAVYTHHILHAIEIKCIGMCLRYVHWNSGILFIWHTWYTSRHHAAYISTVFNFS